MRKFNEYRFWMLRRVAVWVLATVLVGLFLFGIMVGICSIWFIFLAINLFLVVLMVPVDVEKISDITKIVDAGIMHTPGLRINGKMKSTGRIPKPEEIKKWISGEK